MNQETDKKLELLFDYQTFAENEELQRIIDRINARFPSRKLSDDEAELVAAAGTPDTAFRRKQRIKYS